jgi:IclR family transcriptional regulator, acetate operon repressor
VELWFHNVVMAGTQAIDRAAQLLVRVVESTRPLGVGELADSTELPKSTTSRLVAALERQGLLQRGGDRGPVRPGPVLLRFAQRTEPDVTMVELADDHLDALAETSGETVNLAVPTPLGVDQLSQRDSRHFIGSTNWVGKRVPYHLTANGKVFLAWGAAASEHSTDDLGAMRARGYTTAVDELEVGLSALAAPVFGGDGNAVAALSISGPTIRLTRSRIEELAPTLVQHANALSRKLGHQDDKRGAA